jgi:mono/diheme cytochrome c family protein
LLVDVAVDPSGSYIAVANAAGWGTTDSVMFFGLPGPGNTLTSVDGSIAVACASVLGTLGADGQVTSVTFVAPRVLAAQLREPAGIAFYEFNDTPLAPVVPVPTALVNLNQPSRNDSGHAMFHATTGAGVACASCHPEAGDDGHAWMIGGYGLRRTQSLRGGILATAPFQWSGDMPDFEAVVSEIFVKRMNSPVPDSERVDLLAQWIDEQPALRATPPDPEAVARGKRLFESEDLACTHCHTGDRFTNNQNDFVGTEAVVQVPSLAGVSFRAPLMHSGCAKTLAERAMCDGGEMHGHTEQLSSEEYDDLNAYLESL